MADKGTKRYLVELDTNERTGEVVREMWFDMETGQLDRPNGPALIEHFETEGRARRTETYYIQGQVAHPLGEPSTVVVDVETGFQVFKEWSSANGAVSRLEGQPAIVSIDLETKVVIKEQYWEHGKPHRVNGPADIERDRFTGEVTSARFFMNGNEIFASDLPELQPRQP